MRPGSHVARLLLDPEDLLEVRVAGDQLAHVLFGERVEELDPPDRHAVIALVDLVALEVVVDLPRAEDKAGHLLGVDARFGQDGVEAGIAEMLDPVYRLGEAQERLRRHHHERPLLGDHCLAAQEVEVLGRRRQVGHAHVALGRELQEALEPGRRVLGARALVAVREQEGEP